LNFDGSRLLANATQYFQKFSKKVQKNKLFLNGPWHSPMA